MAGSQISTSVSIIDSLFGFVAMSFSNLNNFSEPVIAAGSKVEVAGAFFTFDSDNTVTGFSAVTTATNCYVELTPSGTAGSQILSVAWSETEPVWSDSKQGWYHSAGSNIRTVMSARKMRSGICDRKAVLNHDQNRTTYVPRLRRRQPAVASTPYGSDTDIFTDPPAPLTERLIIAVEDNGTLITAYSFDGNMIENTGVDLTAPNVTRVARLNDTQFAALNSSAKTLTGYTYNGSTIATTGTALAHSPSAGTVLLNLDEDLVLVFHTNTGSGQLYTWDGSTFTTTGSVLATSAAKDKSIVRMGTDVVATAGISGANWFLWVHEFDGSVWSTVASTILAGGGSTVIFVEGDAEMTWFYNDDLATDYRLGFLTYDGTTVRLQRGEYALPDGFGVGTNDPSTSIRMSRDLNVYTIGQALVVSETARID